MAVSVKPHFGLPTGQKL